MTSPEPEKAVPVVAWRKHVSGAGWRFADYVLPVGDELVRKADHEAAMAALRAEVERLRAVIRDHNEDCVQQCQARKASGSMQCPMKGYRRNCGDCPREGMVDTAITAAHGAQGDSNGE